MPHMLTSLAFPDFWLLRENMRMCTTPLQPSPLPCPLRINKFNKTNCKSMNILKSIKNIGIQLESLESMKTKQNNRNTTSKQMNQKASRKINDATPTLTQIENKYWTGPLYLKTNVMRIHHKLDATLMHIHIVLMHSPAHVHTCTPAHLLTCTLAFVPTIPGNDGDISLKIGEGGLMGDPLMVALFWVAFLLSTIGWQQLVAEEGAESGQLLAWHPWSGERMEFSLSQYADDTTKQIVAKPGEDVQALAKRVRCSNDVFDRALAVDGFSQNRGKEELLMHLVGTGSLADRRCERGMCHCQARSSQWRGISAVTWENRHLSLMSFPGGVKPQWRLFTQSVRCGMRAGCRGGSSDASSSVVWSTRHFLALRLSARRRRSTKLSRR